MIIGRIFRPYFHFLSTLGHCWLGIIDRTAGRHYFHCRENPVGEEILEIHSKGDVGLERKETMKYKAVIFDLDGAFRL